MESSTNDARLLLYVMLIQVGVLRCKVSVFGT